jgi:Flp pilus assembly protein TadG
MSAAVRMQHVGLSARLRNDEAGSALLEGAIVVPFLFALVLGALEFSFFFYHQHLVSTGVRDAARYLARTDPTAGGNQTTAQNLASTGSAAGGSARRVTGFDPADVAISFTFVANALDGTTHLRPYRQATAECGGATDQIRIIHVTGSYRYTSLGFLEFFGLSIPTTTVTHSERCIGPG